MASISPPASYRGQHVSRPPLERKNALGESTWGVVHLIKVPLRRIVYALRYGKL
jgi:hypothetical protein